MQNSMFSIAWISRAILGVLLALNLGCNETPNESSNDRQIIQSISEAHLSIPAGQTTQLEIAATGMVTTSGWSDPVLVPVEYITPPADGIYEFTFYATPPKQLAAEVMTPIDATYRMKTVPDDLTGVRIIAETNDFVVMRETTKPAPLPEIIYEITSASLKLISGSIGIDAQLEITAMGNTTSGGWSNPVLIPAEYVTAPADGIYDFTFYATPPSLDSTQVISPIDVKHVLNPAPSNITGVRIHSKTNTVLVSLGDSKPNPAPTAINEITEVTLSLINTLPAKLSIDVAGMVDSSGWTDLHLEQHEYLVAPADGIYEFTFYGSPPVDSVSPESTPVKLTHVLESIPDNLTGIRIFSATNHIEKSLSHDSPPPDAAIIYEITDVTLSVIETDPRQLDIRATGIVTSAGWTSPVLVPVTYIVAPADGIYDYTFYATPPAGVSAAVMSSIDATLRLNPLSDNIKGIRIHSETNDVLAMIDTTSPSAVPSNVFSVTSVALSHPSDFPDQLDIAVSGVVTSGGWSNPMLIPYEYLVPPADGIYDFTFYATPPTGNAAAVMAPINVVHRLTTMPTDMQGVRIHAKTNSIETLLTPGPDQAACEFVSGNTFQTAKLYEGGLGPPGITNLIHWQLVFNADGSFHHIYSDFGEIGTYYCDATGFHLLNSIGEPYVPGTVTVDLTNQSITLPFLDGDKIYYLVTP